MKKNAGLITTFVATFVLSLPVVCSAIKTNEIRVVSAVNSETNVLDELLEVPEFRSAYLNGEYVADSSKDEFDVLYAVENGYDGLSSYLLYLYVWNKSGKGFSDYNFENKYNSVEFYSFATYKAFSLDMQYINCSADHQFLKYRVKNIDQANFLNAETGRREYGIKGIEIAHFEGDLQKFKEYPIAKKWNFEGNSNDLFVTYNSSFEYLQLELGGGAFPFGEYTDFFANGYQYQHTSTTRTQQNLYYIYFNIPKTYQNSGSLYSIHADYYDFNLSDKIAFLLDNHEQSFYEQNYDYFDNLLMSGYSINDEVLSDYSSDYIFHAYFDQYTNARKDVEGIDNSKRFHVGPYYVNGGQTGYWEYFDYSYTSDEFLNKYKLLIPISNLTSDVSGHVISSCFDRTFAELVSGQSSSEVYNVIHYCNPGTGREDSDAIETGWDLVSEASNHWAIWSWWHQAEDMINVHDLKCIEHINFDDSNIADKEFGAKYYLNNNDVSSIKSLLSENDDTYVFRFKLDDSSARELNYFNKTGTHVGYGYSPKKIGFVATEYHGVVDFDVLDMTFINEDDELETMPVVSDPINVFPDVPSPYVVRGGCTFWRTILMILIMLVLILLLFLFLKWFIPWKRNKQLIHAVKSSGKSSSNHSTVKHYNYNIKKTYINRPKSKKKKRRK